MDLFESGYSNDLVYLVDLFGSPDLVDFVDLVDLVDFGRFD